LIFLLFERRKVGFGINQIRGSGEA